MTTITPPPDLLEGLGATGAHFLDIAELRRRIAAFYRQHEGLRSSGKTEDEYERLIFPNDAQGWRHQAADDMFSCALRFLACCRLLGIRHKVIEAPYRTRNGMAISDVETVARTYDALVLGASAVAAYEPEEGDAMLAGFGNSLHCSCIVGVTDERDLACVDGGQGRRGDIAIEANLYRLTRSKAGASVRSIEAPTYSPELPGPAKPVRSYVDVGRLVVNAGLLRA